MMATMKTLAKFGGWEVIVDANSIVSIHFGAGQWICTHASAYEAIKNEVKDPAIRTELIRQWSLSMKGGRS